jgi:hypothetical protein
MSGLLEKTLPPDGEEEEAGEEKGKGKSEWSRHNGVQRRRRSSLVLAETARRCPSPTCMTG